MKFVCIVTCFGLCFLSAVRAQNRTIIDINDTPATTLEPEVASRASEVITALNQAFVDSLTPVFPDDVFTPAGRSSFEKLWENSQFYCPQNRVVVDLLALSEGFEIRRIPLLLRERDEEGKRIEHEGVLIITPSGYIEDVYFGLDHHQYSDLLQAADNVTDTRRRKIVLNFVEIFRTAYNRKDLPFIERVFSDNALIIVGKVVRVAETDHVGDAVTTPQVEYVRRKKSDYLDQLRLAFEKNQSINVRFDDITLVRHPMHESIYGVTLLQHWVSTEYSDSGYLFLMIDFRDENEPMIHVRTWQPEREVSPEEVFQLSDFWIAPPASATSQER